MQAAACVEQQLRRRCGTPCRSNGAREPRHGGTSTSLGGEGTCDKRQVRNRWPKRYVRFEPNRAHRPHFHACLKKDVSDSSGHL